MVTVFFGRYATGITLTSQAQNPVSVTGTITPSSGIGLLGPGGGSNSWTVSNSGLIGGNAGTGIQLGNNTTYVAHGIVTNGTNGLIAGANIGVNIGGSGTLTNLPGGSIVGTQADGVYFGTIGSGTVFNSGTIVGGFAGEYMRGGGLVINNAGATISGGTYGIKFANSSGTIINSGVITGTNDAAVIFYTNSSANRLIVAPSAVFNGYLDGGAGTMELTSAASAGRLAGFGSSITNFGSLQFDGGSHWTVVGTASKAGFGTLTIGGFTTGDTIDLTGFTEATESFSGNSLILTGASTNTATLHFQGSFSSGSFGFMPDGSGGTDITAVNNTFNWIGGSADWNTPSDWDAGAIPNSVANATISNAGSNTVTIGNGESIAVNSVTIGGSDTLAVAGALTAQSITDSAVLSFAGNQSLAAAPLSLTGSLLVQSGGTLTLGANETVTLPSASASFGGGGSIINQGTISASSSATLGIVPLNFINSGTILAAGVSLKLGYDDGLVGGVRGTWINTGVIELSSGASLNLDGAITTGGIGTITGAPAVSLSGTLNNAGTTLSIVGTGQELGTVNLTHSGVVSGGTIVDKTGTGFIFNDGAFSGVTYQGPLNIANNAGGLIVANGLTVVGAGGTLPGTVAITSQNDVVTFSNQLPILSSAGETLDNLTINIGNTVSADILEPSFSGGTFDIGAEATIVSSIHGALAELDVLAGVTDLQGTLAAIANGGTFSVVGNTFQNDGTMIAGNADNLLVSSAISGGTGTIEISGDAVARFTTTVAATQSLAFADDTGTLQLTNPSSFGATIFAFHVGNTIDLAGINATSASWAPGALSIFNGTTLLATLAIAGDYSAATFHVNSDGANGSAITVGAPAPCFAAGSRILTPRGNVAIERLREGDMVLTVSGKHERIQWIGYRHVDCRRHISRQRALPIRIAAHAFGQDRPKRPLLLSPDHSVYVEGVLIPIKFLVNDSTILQIDVDAVSYFHIELDRHEIVLAEGLPVETYLETGGRNAFANTGEVMQLHPDFAPNEARVAMIWQSFGYAPLIGSDGELERTMRMLEIQADLLCTPLRRRRRRG